MKEEIYKENIDLTEKAIEELKKMPKEKQMYILGIIKGINIADKSKTA